MHLEQLSLLARRGWHRLDKEEDMATFLHVLLIIAIVLVCLFVLSFIVYFFNLDMKLTAAIEPLMLKHYDKIDRDKHL